MPSHDEGNLFGRQSGRDNCLVASNFKLLHCFFLRVVN